MEIKITFELLGALQGLKETVSEIGATYSSKECSVSIEHLVFDDYIITDSGAVAIKEVKPIIFIHIRQGDSSDFLLPTDKYNSPVTYQISDFKPEVIQNFSVFLHDKFMKDLERRPEKKEDNLAF